MRISLRELMILVTVLALELAAVKYASAGVLRIVQALTGLAVCGFLVRAVVDRGRGQTFAIGFVAFAAAYAIAAHAFDQISTVTRPVRLPVISSRFPPTRMWLAMCPIIATPGWSNAETGKPLREDPTRPYDGDPGRGGPRSTEGGMMILRGSTRDYPVAPYDELMQKQTFTDEEIWRAIFRADQKWTRYAYLPMPWPKDVVMLGHCYGVIVLGYVGGRIAQLIRWRYGRRSSKLTS